MTDPNNGRLLSKRYQLVELVGKGAMGRVYLAEDTRLGGVTVAVKFLSQTMLTPKMRQRFFREAEICAKLGEKSIHIVRVRDYGLDESEVPFYVMEFLHGESLGDLIQSKSLPLSRFVSITRQICLGLQAAHNGIVYKGQLCPIIHRDIKPSNILVVQDSTLGELVKVLDFGIAKLIESNGAQTRSFMGTLAYCSPEQMEGRELDSRSDIYSLGVMMYELLTGDMPIFPTTNSFGGWFKAHHEAPPKPFAIDLPLPLKHLVFSCMAKKAEERPQNVTEILKTIEILERHPSYNTKPSLQSQPATVSQKKDPTPSIQEICFQHTWPEDKPIKKIVFPQVLPTNLGVIPTLWVMLSQTDIDNRRASTRYNHFLCLMSPHPMLLWLTALYSREKGPLWLPCYLDLKTKNGQRTARLLGKSGSYRLLFFALEEPQRCQQVVKFIIDPGQCKMLSKWAKEAWISGTSGSPKISKQVLKTELEKLKPKIQAKLDAIHNQKSTGNSQ